MIQKMTACLVGMLAAMSCVVPAAGASEVHQAQVEARVIDTPQIVRGSDGKRHLAYELHVMSFYGGDKPLKLVGITIFADDSTKPIATFAGAAVDALLAHPASNGPPSDGVLFASGQTRTFFLWITLPEGSRAGHLRQALEFRTEGGDIERADNIRTTVNPVAPLQIGPPLAGGRWLAVEGPGNHLSHHWGSLVPVDGSLTIPQRFAIDWFGLDDTNHSVRGQHETLSATHDADWIGYGSDILAVADGVVVDARDGVPNGTPLGPQPEPDDLTARTLYGNFVILKIAPHIYAHYAHLQTGSVGVKIGDHVHRGAVIGHLGQTGAAGAPHLHIHLSDKPTFEQSEGLAFVIDAFVMRGRGHIEDTFDPSQPAALDLPVALPRKAEMPLDGDVVSFPKSATVSH